MKAKIKNNAIGMTLKEYLNTIDDDRIIYIGAKSNFVFIGTRFEYDLYFKRTVDHFYKDAVVARDKALLYMNQGYKDRLKRIFTQAIEKMPIYVFNPDHVQPDDTETIADILESCKESTDAIAELNKSMFCYYDAVKKNSERFMANRKYLENFKEYEDRMIIDHYGRLTGEGETIIIEGLENGNFWMHEEFQRKIKEYQEEDKKAENGAGAV